MSTVTIDRDDWELIAQLYRQTVEMLELVPYPTNSFLVSDVMIRETVNAAIAGLDALSEIEDEIARVDLLSLSAPVSYTVANRIQE